MKGSTLMEVLIALAIISVCSVFTVLIYLNLQKSSLPFFRLKAIEAARYYMDRSLKERTYDEQTFRYEEFTVKKFVSRHPTLMDCFIIKMIVFDTEKTRLFELESTVYQHANK
jgi:prepilin-type N-terminal cleavage/methylation domain-containing protein